MRLWMINPKILCTKHLGGEHVECHMFLGTLQKKLSIDGYINNNLFEPLALLRRHNILAQELIFRGGNHNTPLLVKPVDFGYLTSEQLNHKVDRKEALRDLITRCEKCRDNFKTLKDQIDPLDPFDITRKTLCPVCECDLTSNLDINSAYIHCPNCWSCLKVNTITRFDLTVGE